MPGYVKSFLDNQVREVTQDWKWTEVRQQEHYPHYVLWDRDEAIASVVRKVPNGYAIDGRPQRFDDLQKAQHAAEREAAQRILNETPDERQDRLMDATARAIERRRFAVSETPEYKQGETTIRRILDHNLSDFYSTTPPRSKHEALDALRDITRAHIAFVDTGQNYAGTAWQDPNYTAGARHGITRFYLETKKELGLSHLPGQTQQRNKHYGFSAGMEL